MSSPNPLAQAADNLPADLAAAHALILALQGELATARQQAGERAIEIERLRLALAKARRELYGQSSERGRLLVEQLELQLEELEETSAENEVAGELSTPAPTLAVTPRKPARRPLPEALPRERIVHPGPCVCDRCGGDALRKIGEDVLESLECEPRRWKVVQHVREKFACRSCEAVSQTPAPSHPIRRGRAGPNLLAMVLAGKYAQHLPLHRQSAAYPQAFLDDYRGILMSDGYAAWRTLDGATHLGCMAHARRRFVDALKARPKPGGPPEQALKFFEQLYRVEKQARSERPDTGETQAGCLRRFRQQHSIPVLNALKQWLDAIAPKVLPDRPPNQPGHRHGTDSASTCPELSAYVGAL